MMESLYVRLKDIAREVSRKNKEDLDLEVFSVTKYDGFVKSLDYFKKQVFSRNTETYKIVYPGQFAYATIHLDEGSIGYLDYNSPALISPMYTVFEIDESQVDRQYLVRILKTPEMLSRYSTLGSGSVHRRKAISFSKLSTVKIPLPPIAEQKRIAAILDKADAVRRKRREAIRLTEELLRSVFLDMFGDPVTNPMGWDVAHLKTLITPGDKINYGVVQPGDEVQGGKPIIRVGDFDNGRINKSRIKLIESSREEKHKKSRLRGDEILVACVGSIGEIASVNSSMTGWNIVRAVARLPLVDSISREYIFNYLQTDFVQSYFKKETRTVSQPTLNIKHIELTPILIPDWDRQMTFQRFSMREQSCLETNKQHLYESENLFNSLLQRAFTGNL